MTTEEKDRQNATPETIAVAPIGQQWPYLALAAQVTIYIQMGAPRQGGDLPWGKVPPGNFRSGR